MTILAKTMVDVKHMIRVTDLIPMLGMTHSGGHTWLKNNGHKTIVVGSRAYLPPDEVHRALEGRGFNYERMIVSIQMLKGGVGKTTLALNLGIRASMYGSRVLLLDLDQQGNLTSSLIPSRQKPKVLADLVQGKCSSMDEVILQISPYVHLVPSNIHNSILERLFLESGSVSDALAKYIEPIKSRYDLIIIDTAPNLSAMNAAAANTSSLVILPVIPDDYSFDGLSMTLVDLEGIKQKFSSRFKLKVLFNRFDARESSSHQLLRDCLTTYSEMMLQSFIRTSSEFKNTIHSGHTIFSKKGTAAEDIDSTTKELLGFSLDDKAAETTFASRNRKRQAGVVAPQPLVPNATEDQPRT